MVNLQPFVEKSSTSLFSENVNQNKTPFFLSEWQKSLKFFLDILRTIC